MSDKGREEKKKLQTLLKQAKRALGDEDFDECISITNDILKLDRENFFAYIFKGKCLQSKSRKDEALKNYVKASQIKPDETLAWKGQLSIRVEDSDFVSFFETLTNLAKVLHDKNDPQTEVVNYIKDYINNHGLIFKPLHIYYLKQTIPGLSELGDIVGYQVANPSNSLKTLIKIIQEEEEREIKNIKDKVKLQLSLNMTEAAKIQKYNEKTCPVYSSSEIPQLYEKLIDLEQNDKERYNAQDKYLRYKYDLLLIAPVELKSSLRSDILDIVEGLVLINSPSEFAWKLYFDWLDLKSLADLELAKIVKFIKLFGQDKGYGCIFYNFLLSDICPFDKTKILDYLKPIKRKHLKKLKDNTDDEIIEDQDKEDGDDNSKYNDFIAQRFKIFDIQPQEILTNMCNALSTIKNSIICHRITLDYCIHLKDYSMGLDLSTQFSRATTSLKNLTGLNIPNSKTSQTLNLAIIYTYYEAPKNFSKALALYDIIASKDPNNNKVKIGKALILVETNRYDEASNIFLDLIDENPHDIEAIQEYGWCQLHLKNYELGRKYLNNAITILQDDEIENVNTGNSMEILSKLMYRLAISYYMEFDSSEVSLSSESLNENVKTCSLLLLKCLKISPNYAPAFTTLGLIYYNYTDNKDRAIKCFYKAFQLDPAEIEASYNLVEHFTSINDWEMADVICRGVIENDRARRQLNSLFNKSKDNAWPYRILGCASMEFKDDVKAIEYFQTALRINPLDTASWLALGEAYIFRGRLEASVKVFNHVIKLQSGVQNTATDVAITSEMEDKADWHTIFLLSTSLTSMLEFDQSVKLLKKLLKRENMNNNICILTILIETLVLRCDSETNRGAILRASDTLVESFEYLFEAFEIESGSIKLWKALSDLLSISLKIQSSLVKLPINKINNLLKNIAFEKNELWDDIDFMNFNVEELISKKQYITVFHLFFTLSCIGGYLSMKAGEIKILRSSLIYNIAVSLISWHKDSKLEVLRDVAIKNLNKAISIESDNAEYWNSLGIISLDKNAKIAQHCFIKALSLDPKAVYVWFNLGMLYIKYFDYDLANQCFIRAQSIAPGNPESWIGQALVANYNNNEVSSRELFTHSYVLSKGINPANTLLYAVSVIENIMRDGSEERNLAAVQQLTVINYGILNYLKLYPEDTFALDLSVTIIERLYLFNKGLQYSQNLCEILEKKYEETETEEILMNYAKAKCQMSRLLLAGKEYSKAVEICEEVGSLLDTVEDLNIEVQKCMMSCFTVLGLSLYFQGEFDKSLDEFRKLLEAFPENKRIVVLISQVLYASGESEAIQAAMDELLNNIAQHGTSLIVSMTIAAISLVENWTDYIVAVKEVLDELPLDVLIKDTYKEVPKMLTMISKKLNLKKEKDSRIDKIWQRNAFLFPGDSISWSNIDKEVSLELNINASDESAMSVSQAYVHVNRLRETQRSILLSGGISEDALKSLYNLVK